MNLSGASFMTRLLLAESRMVDLMLPFKSAVRAQPVSRGRN